MPSVSFVLRSATGNSNDTSDTSAANSVSNDNTTTENENSEATTTLPVPSVMTLMALKRRQGTTTRTANISSTNNNNDDDIKSMVEIINKTVASSTNNSTVALPDASSTTQPPTKKKKTEQQQLVWAKDGVDSETAELHPAYLLKNGNETCQIRWTSNGVVATVPKSRISFDLPTRRRKKSTNSSSSSSSKKGESSRRSSAAANSKSGNATTTKDNNKQKRKVSFEQAAELTQPASSSSPSSEGNDGCEEQNAELILLQTEVEKLTKELASTKAMGKLSIEEARATIDEYETLIDKLTKRSALLKRSKQVKNLKLENAELDSQILPVKILPAELPTETFEGNNLDPMTDEEKKLVFTPDGSFLEDEATLAKKDRQKYLDRISFSQDTNFLSCQICGDEVDEDEDLCCTSCPRSFHKRCLSTLQSSNGGSATECTCINDQVIHQEEEIRPIVLFKLDSAYNHLSGMKSYNTCIITLGMLYQIVARLKEYAFGSIFFNAVNTQLVTDYLATVEEPMCYQQILLLLESGAFVGDEDTESGVDIFEQAVLMCIANIKDVFHNCFLYNAKGSKYYLAGKVQETKWIAFFNKYIAQRLTKGMSSELASYDSWYQNKLQTSFRARHFVVGPKNTARNPIAVFDPDTKQIVKQYTSKASAKLAILLLHSLGYNCGGLTKSNASVVLDRAQYPENAVFGYQWIPTSLLRSGDFRVKK